MMLLAPRLRARALTEKYVSIPLARLLQALRISPNSLTLTGLAVSIGAAYLLSEGWLIAGGAMMLAGAFLDMLDGPLARLKQQASRSGAFLDSVADRLGEAAVLFGLLVFYVRDGHELGTYLTVGALVASQMVSYLRARAEGLGIPSDVGFMGRPERIIVLGAGLLLGLQLYAMGLILSGVALSQYGAFRRLFTRTRA